MSQVSCLRSQKLSKTLKTPHKVSKVVKIVKIVKNYQNCQKLSKMAKIVKCHNSLTFNDFSCFPKSNVGQWVSHSVTKSSPKAAKKEIYENVKVKLLKVYILRLGWPSLKGMFHRNNCHQCSRPDEEDLINFSFRVRTNLGGKTFSLLINHQDQEHHHQNILVKNIIIKTIMETAPSKSSSTKMH